MCGILGMVNASGIPIDRGELSRVNDLVAHRGPDDAGVYTDKHVGLGHRRLSILDLSAEGHQPMSHRGQYVITYNGEVYNYIEIRESLIKLGYSFNSQTDTEVILAAYAEWGAKCVSRFNGMWAFAIHDKKRNILFCSRDRFGVKPFYFLQSKGRFVVGSEIKQLLPFVNRCTVNGHVLSDYLLLGLSEHNYETFFTGVFKLPQSHNLIYDLKKHTFSIKRYYRISQDSDLDSLPEDEAVNRVRDCLNQAIQLRLRSDVKVGTCLSGGLDSSSIAAMASKSYCQQSKDPFTAIHAKSIEKKTDESKFALCVASHCGLDLTVVEPSINEMTEQVDEVVYTQEEPFGGPSIFMQYFVMRAARVNGCAVMLDGQGGDETLFGYESYYPYYFATLLKQFRLRQYVSELRSIRNFKLSKLQILRQSAIMLSRNRLRFLDGPIRKWRLGAKCPIDINRHRHLHEFVDFKRFQMRAIELSSLPHLLRYEDKNSMRHSVETRLPFIDFNFVELAISLNDRLKFRDGYLKYLLRKAVEGILPHEVTWRTNKFGFEAPTDTWMRSQREAMLREIQASDVLDKYVHLNRLSKLNSNQIWRLFNVAVWERMYNVSVE